MSDREREKAWTIFCVRSPEFGDGATRENQLANEIYDKQFQNAVDSGKMTFADALESVRIEVTRRIGFEDIQKSRNRT
jgi:hypothetical protein